jgi:CRP-like cAMP-binding protein
MDYSLLSDAPLFKGMNPCDIETILNSVPFRVRKFQSASMIAQTGEPINSLMIIVSGVVKAEMVDFAGRVIKIEDISAPEALASAFIFGGRNRFPVNVISVSDVELLLIDKPDFLKLLRNNDTVLVNFLNMVSNRSQFLSEKIKFLNFKTIKGKLAHYILQKAEKNTHYVILDRTQNDLANFFGVTRPSVARALSDLEADGFIVAKGKSIRIINEIGLANLTVD